MALGLTFGREDLFFLFCLSRPMLFGMLKRARWETENKLEAKAMILGKRKFTADQKHPTRFLSRCGDIANRLATTFKSSEENHLIFLHRANFSTT